MVMFTSTVHAVQSGAYSNGDALRCPLPKHNCSGDYDNYLAYSNVCCAFSFPFPLSKIQQYLCVFLKIIIILACFCKFVSTERNI